jgi:folate-binding protein YgfZ
MNDPSKLMDTVAAETGKAWAIPHFGALRISGEDAASFLQGQLCNDVRRLDQAHAQLTGLSDAKGRLQAIAYALAPQPDAIDLILPREILEPVAATLQRYVLRARLEITDFSDAVELAAVSGSAASAWLADHGMAQAVPGPMAVTAAADSRLVRLPGSDNAYLLCQAPGTHPIAADSGEKWELQRIRAGDPAIFAATRGLFVAQMTNLDLLDGISFDKGCYTGQEVVARTQHLGRIKRRMFRFAVPGGKCPDPGTAVTSGGQKVGNVVRSAGAECLAVVRTDALDGEIFIALPGATVAPELLSLPYPVAGS